jgi:hypothetical protein
MKRSSVIVAVAAFLVASACGPPPPLGLSHDFAVSYRALSASPFIPGVRTVVQGTITNTGVSGADYSVQLVSSSGETTSAAARNVLVGETAVWWVFLDGDVTVAQDGVTSSPRVVSPVAANAVITSQRTSMLADFDAPLATTVQGTLTNTGVTSGSFTVELQANSGEVGTALASGVSAGQTVPWAAVFHGSVTARIIRITTSEPSP